VRNGNLRPATVFNDIISSSRAKTIYVYHRVPERIRGMRQRPMPGRTRLLHAPRRVRRPERMLQTVQRYGGWVCVGGRERGRSVFFSRHAVMFDPFVYYRLRTQGRPAGGRHGMDGSRRPVHGEVVQGGRDHGDPNAVHHAVSATVPAETGHLLSHLSRWATYAGCTLCFGALGVSVGRGWFGRRSRKDGCRPRPWTRI